MYVEIYLPLRIAVKRQNTYLFDGIRTEFQESVKYDLLLKFKRLA